MPVKSKKLASKLTDDQVKFWAANTNLDSDQIQQWYAEFEKEAQKNDKLDKKTFVKFFQQLKHKTRDSDDFLNLTFDAFDADHSGLIGKQYKSKIYKVIGLKY
jgi:Ca2+-binding EF-hand superfamily protein